MTDLTATITTAIGHLDWCTQIPHTIDRIIGIYAEATASTGRALPVEHRATNAAIVAAWDSTRAGRDQLGPGHADPTTTGTSHSTRDDADLASIDAAVALIAEAALDIDHRTSDALGLEHWCPPASARSRDDRVRDAVSRLHHAHANVPAAAAIDHDIVELVRIDLADTAEWLHGKALGIWKASKGETKTAAVQRAIVECKRCGSWRKGSIAVRNDACAQCLKFNQHHHAWPTEAIVRRWEYGQAATPGQILEARATTKRKTRAKAS